MSKHHRVHDHRLRAVPPAELIKDMLYEKRWSIDDLSKKSGLSINTLTSLVFRAETAINSTIANGLSIAFGQSVKYWLKVQAEWEYGSRQERFVLMDNGGSMDLKAVKA